MPPAMPPRTPLVWKFLQLLGFACLAAGAAGVGMRADWFATAFVVGAAVYAAGRVGAWLFHG